MRADLPAVLLVRLLSLRTHPEQIPSPSSSERPKSSQTDELVREAVSSPLEAATEDALCSRHARGRLAQSLTSLHEPVRVALEATAKRET